MRTTFRFARKSHERGPTKARIFLNNRWGLYLGWERIPNNEHVKRALEIAAIREHLTPVTLIYYDKFIAESFRADARYLGVDVFLVKPCPCGYLGLEECECSPAKLRRYHQSAAWKFAIKRPIQVLVFGPNPLEIPTLFEKVWGETLDAVARRVRAAQNIYPKGFLPEAYDALRKLTTQRRWDSERIVQVAEVAKNICALDGELFVNERHIFEAASYSEAGEMIVWAARKKMKEAS